MAIPFTLWTIVDHLLYESALADYQTFLNRLNLTIVCIGMILLVRFVRIFPREIFRTPRWAIIGTDSIAAAFAIITLFTPLIVSEAFMESYGSNFHNGPLFLVFAAGVIAICLFVIGTLYLKVHRLKGKEQAQVRIVSWGMGATIVINIVANVLLPIITGSFAYSKFGASSTILFITFTTYAIVTKGLFDVRTIISRTIIFTGLLGFTLSIFSILIFIVTAYLPSPNQTTTFFINLTAAMGVGLSFEQIRKWLQDKTDRWLYSKQYEQREVLGELNVLLRDVQSVDQAMETALGVLSKVFHLRQGAMFTLQPTEENSYGIRKITQFGYGSTDKLMLDERDHVLEYFSLHHDILSTASLMVLVEDEDLLLSRRTYPVEEYDSLSSFIRTHTKHKAVLDRLNALDVSLVVPLTVKDRPLALMLLGTKRSDDAYDHKDYELLSLVGEEVIASLERAQLIEGDQLKSEFVSIASHELLTPISAIEGYLSMILDEKIGGKNLDPTITDHMEKIYSSAKRLSLLIKDILTVSKIDSGKLKNTPQQVDCAQVIEKVVKQLEAVAKERSITIDIVPPPYYLPPVFVDPDRMSQVFNNLIGNAIKYNRQGGTIVVGSSIHKSEGTVQFSVEDTGLGMTKPQMSHLFEKFYRVDSPDTEGIMGTGLGLYITKAVLENSGSSLKVESMPHKGTRFSFRVPIFQVESANLSMEAGQPEHATMSAALSSKQSS